jgi:hypothetical protein
MKNKVAQRERTESLVGGVESSDVKSPESAPDFEDYVRRLSAKTGEKQVALRKKPEVKEAWDAIRASRKEAKVAVSVAKATPKRVKKSATASPSASEVSKASKSSTPRKQATKKEKEMPTENIKMSLIELANSPTLSAVSSASSESSSIGSPSASLSVAPRGRPRKYATKEEARLARIAKTREGLVKKGRIKQTKAEQVAEREARRKMDESMKAPAPAPEPAPSKGMYPGKKVPVFNVYDERQLPEQLTEYGWLNTDIDGATDRLQGAVYEFKSWAEFPDKLKDENETIFSDEYARYNDAPITDFLPEIISEQNGWTRLLRDKMEFLRRSLMDGQTSLNYVEDQKVLQIEKYEDAVREMEGLYDDAVELAKKTREAPSAQTNSTIKRWFKDTLTDLDVYKGWFNEADGQLGTILRDMGYGSKSATIIYSDLRGGDYNKILTEWKAGMAEWERGSPSRGFPSVISGRGRDGILRRTFNNYGRIQEHLAEHLNDLKEPIDPKDLRDYIHYTKEKARLKAKIFKL